MQIEFKSSGGLAYFPGLNAPMAIDSECLNADEADALKAEVAALDFFNLPVRLGSIPLGAADMREYTVTVRDGKRQHTIHCTEATTDPPGLLSFLNHLENLALAARLSQLSPADDETSSN